MGAVYIINRRAVNKWWHFHPIEQCGPWNVLRISCRNCVYYANSIASTVCWKQMNITHMSISRWMDKQNLVFSGVFFSHKEEWTSDTCYNMHQPWKHYAKWHQRTNITQFNLHELSGIGKFIEQVEIIRSWDEGGIGG